MHDFNGSCATLPLDRETAALQAEGDAQHSYRMSFQRVQSLRMSFVSPSITTFRCLPFRLLGRQELVQNGDILLQVHKPIIQLFANSRLVIAQLCIEILSVWGGAHGGGEDWLDEHGVMLL